MCFVGLGMILLIYIEILIKWWSPTTVSQNLQVFCMFHLWNLDHPMCCKGSVEESPYPLQGRRIQDLSFKLRGGMVGVRTKKS